LRVPGTLNGFELAVRAILGQQVSIAGARTMVGRLVQALGEPLSRPVGTLTHLFPSPERVAQANLQMLGLTTRRAAALRALAEGVATGAIVLDRGADRTQTISRLLAVPGIGPWTGAYIGMRALGDPDAFPATDLGLHHALKQSGYALSPRRLAAHAEAWRPWRSYAVMHLWTSLTEARQTRLAS
jgi:AraC family transcriptional regulator of adaptative response / DNA-3-methyladenine glycosylase II